jgi:PAS domain-containing protein
MFMVAILEAYNFVLVSYKRVGERIRLRTVGDNGSMAMHTVIVADADGVIRQWNAGAEALFGYPSPDAIGQSLNLLVPAHLQDAYWAGFHGAMKNPKIKDLAADLPVRCADGQLRAFAGCGCTERGKAHQLAAGLSI